MKAKIFTLTVFAIMLVNVSRAYSQNLLTDGDFSQTQVMVPINDTVLNVWNFWHYEAIDANPTVTDGVFNYYINPSGYAGTNTWEIQMGQLGFTLLEGHTYRLSFDVKADADRTFGVYLGENGGGWMSLLGSDKYTQNATTEWQKITLDFNATCVFPTHKLSFELGTVSTSISFDNVMLEDLGPYTHSVGILGFASGSWDVDVKMLTTDGIHYTISDLPLTHGTMIFRQDDTWCYFWGNTSFPTGAGILYGPAIPVPNDGNYNISFNRETAEYSFICAASCLPFIGIIGSAVPPDHNWETDANMQTGDGITYTLPGVTFTDGEAKFRKDDSWDVSWGGTGFPAGIATPDGQNIPVAAGTYTVSFNPGTGEYNFAYPGIGILGDALPGWWTEDIDLQTTDGIIYTLLDQPFNNGQVKFRLNNEWVVNWGDWTFPTGYGYQDGPNIPVPAGYYNVTFNMVTGEYSFTASRCPEPAIQCPQTVYTQNTPGLCGAYVFYPETVPATNCGGAGVTISQTAGLPSGSLFPMGFTTNAFELTNSDGMTATCSYEVYVYDGEPPVIENLTVSPEVIWPPDHRMVPVTVNYNLSDNCGGVINSQIWIWTNDPEDGPGDGKTVTDFEVFDEHHILLRAERSGKGVAREYYITVYAWDDSWIGTASQIVVTVPHDMTPGKTNLTVKSGGMQVDDAAMAINVKIWPNPGETYFNVAVESSSDECIELRIHDVSGRLVEVVTVTDKNSFRFGDDLQAGIYLATVRQGAFFKTVRIAKE